MLYREKDGAQFSPLTTADLVRQLHETSYTQAEDDAAWMMLSAEWLREMGLEVRHDTTDNFVADLLSAGIIEVIGE